CSAAFVKLNDPVRIVAESITMTLLWAMACWASMRVWMPTLLRNVAALYLSVSLDLSSTARTLTPRLWASTRTLAIGAEVKLYACTRICCVAVFASRTTASVAPPLGEKYTATRAGEKGTAACPRDGRRPSITTRMATQQRDACGVLCMQETS